MGSLISEHNIKRITSLEKGTWTSRTYREAVLKQMKMMIPYDAYCFTTVDPSTLLSTGAVTEQGIEAIHNQLFRNEYMEEDIHKYRDLFHSGQHTAILHAATRSHAQPSSRYMSILQPAGFGDELRSVLVSNNACWGYLTLYRNKETPVFTEEERLLIQNCTASIAFMLRATSRTLIEEIKNQSPVEPGIIIVSNSLELLSFNEPAQYWLSQLRQLEHITPDVLPRPVRAVSSHLQREKHFEPSTSSDNASQLSKVCIQLPDGRYLVLHASLMQQFAGPHQIAIRLEQALPQELLPLLAESHGLSARERELLGYVLRSYSSKEIAALMHISAYTVQDHLKSIFAKTGVYSRRELIWHFVSRFQLTDIR